MFLIRNIYWFNLEWAKSMKFQNALKHQIAFLLKGKKTIWVSGIFLSALIFPYLYNVKSEISYSRKAKKKLSLPPMGKLSI